MLEAELARRASLGQNVAEGAEAAGTWFDSVYDEYIRQCAEYEKMMDAIRRTPGESARRFGDPVTLPGKVDRYAFWPKNKAQFSVLYYAAVACVCRPAAGMKLERVNSAAGYINSRLRSNMSHSKLRDYVLGQEWLKENLKVISAPRSLIDLAAWRIYMGGADSDDESSDSDSSDSDSESP
jgi:hypothetical protein